MPIRVLLVEDSAAMRSFVGSVLEAAGNYIVDEVKDGFDALRLVARRDQFIDISTLTRSQLEALARPVPDEPPVETGREFMARVRAWLAELPAAGRMIAFTHAGVVREALWALMPGSARVQVIGHAAITRVCVEAEANRIVVLNDSRHVDVTP